MVWQPHDAIARLWPRRAGQCRSCPR
jgi:hypothetical protein